jgi:hypothetical protein
MQTAIVITIPAVLLVGVILGIALGSLDRRKPPRLSIADAHDRDIRRDASLTARLATPSPVLARCDQAGDIAAGLERRRELPLPAPVEDDLVDDGVRIGPRASHTVRVRVVSSDETPNHKEIR